MRLEVAKLLKAELVGDLARRARLVDLVRSAAPDFYSLLPLAESEIRNLVGDQLASPDTETEHLYVVRVGGEDVAIFCCLPATDLDRVRREATLAIIRRLGSAEKAAFLSSLKHYSATIEPLVRGGLYLSRLAVNPAERGKGYGAAAVTALLDLECTEGVLLHVRQDNLAAINLYKRSGFVEVGNGSYEFLAMVYKKS